jgi:3-oxoacyl-[acyl-carrier protein] reductase
VTVAIVTGAASGMGRACAERFAAEGWRVAALDLAESDAGDLMIRADITDEASVAAAVDRVATELGPPRVVVNAAGIYPPTTLETATADLYRRTFDVNVLGTLMVTRAAAPHLVRDGGAIVNFASIDAFVPSPGQLVYCASKAAVVAMTKSLALELAPCVRVNAIAPGWVDTPGNRATGRMEAALETVPLGRAATPDEIADVVWFLAGEGRALYVTGETITATGGSGFR